MKKEERLETRLAEDIKNTGYPVELYAGNYFAKAGWTVHYNTYYTDWDEGKGREIDLIASNGVISNKYHVQVILYLVNQVKKSIDPWVVFTSKSSGEMVGLEQPGWSRMHIADDQININVLPAEKMDAKSTISNFRRFGHSYYVAFKGSQSKPTIFEAITSSVKASLDYLKNINDLIKYDEERTGIKQKIGRRITFIEPVVILDGKLYETYLDRNNKLITKIVDHLPVCFGYVSPKYRYIGFPTNHIVEIVTMDFLPTLISEKMAWLSHIKSTMVKYFSNQVT